MVTFIQPYVNEAQNCGLQVTDTEKLLNLTLASDKSGLQVICSSPSNHPSNFNLWLMHCNGFQVAVHAIGDKANDLILDVFESVNSANGVRDRRFRVTFLAEIIG